LRVYHPQRPTVALPILPKLPLFPLPVCKFDAKPSLQNPAVSADNHRHYEEPVALMSDASMTDK
jgi:hypothetical protein